MNTANRSHADLTSEMEGLAYQLLARLSDD